MRAIIILAVGMAFLSATGPAVRAKSPDVVPRGSEKPSFDCATAKTRTARLICADEELARLDSELGEAVQKRKLQLSATQQSQVVADQLVWIRDRNEHCGLVGKNDAATEVLASSKTCMVSAIRARIAFLGQTEAAVLPANSQSTFKADPCTYFNAETTKIIEGPCTVRTTAINAHFGYILAFPDGTEVSIEYVQSSGPDHIWKINGQSAFGFEINRSHLHGATIDLTQSVEWQAQTAYNDASRAAVEDFPRENSTTATSRPRQKFSDESPSSAATAQGNVQWDENKMLQNTQLNYAIKEIHVCVRDATTIALRSGERDRERIGSMAGSLCNTQLTLVFIAAKAAGMAQKQQTDFVMSLVNGDIDLVLRAGR
jgi:uncharacterized protein YecT (DUF1311 family)